jgi:hypothetical protein
VRRPQLADASRPECGQERQQVVPGHQSRLPRAGPFRIGSRGVGARGGHRGSFGIDCALVGTGGGVTGRSGDGQAVRCRTELTMKTVLAVDQVLLNLGRNFIRDANPHHVQAVDPVEIISVTRIDR